MKNKIIVIWACLIFQVSFASKLPVPYEYQREATSSSASASYRHPQSYADPKKRPPMSGQPQLQQLPMLRIGFSSTKGQGAVNSPAVSATPGPHPLQVPALAATPKEQVVAALNVIKSRPLWSKTPELADFFDNWDEPYPSDTDIPLDEPDQDAYRHQEEFNKFQAGQDYSLYWLPSNIAQDGIKEALHEFRGVDGSKVIIRTIFNYCSSTGAKEVKKLWGTIYELAVALQLKKENPNQTIRLSQDHTNP